MHAGTVALAATAMVVGLAACESGAPTSSSAWVESAPPATGAHATGSANGEGVAPATTAPATTAPATMAPATSGESALPRTTAGAGEEPPLAGGTGPTKDGNPMDPFKSPSRKTKAAPPPKRPYAAKDVYGDGDAWRVPRWSMMNEDLGEVVLRGLTDRRWPATVGGAYEALHKIAKRTSPLAWGVCGQGGDHLELVSGIEEIDADGRRAPSGGVASDWHSMREFVNGIITSIFVRKKGRFRSFILALTIHNVKPSLSPSVAAMGDYRSKCGPTLAPAAKARALSTAVQFYVLVYEFQNSTEYETAVPMSADDCAAGRCLPLRTHLVGSRLWSAAELIGVL